jgi:hypothetical protein
MVDAIDTWIADIQGNTVSGFDQPVVGNIANLIAAWREVQGVINASSLLNVQIIQASGTYTPTPGTLAALVFAIGGGGGGGGALASVGTLSAGSGGGSAAPVMGFITVPTLVPTTVTIGAGGLAGDATGSDGGPGGATTFGALITSAGGLQGKGDASAGVTAQVLPGGAGGATATATTFPSLRTHGLVGGCSYRLSGTIGQSGGGAISAMLLHSDGGNARDTNSTPNGFAGQAGGNQGCGGSGGLSTNATGRAGGAGGGGRVVVLEFG